MPNSQYSFLVAVTTDSRERVNENFSFGGGWGWRLLPRGHSGPQCRWIGVVIGVIGNFLSWVGILGHCVGGLEW